MPKVVALNVHFGVTGTNHNFLVCKEVEKRLLCEL